MLHCCNEGKSSTTDNRHHKVQASQRKVPTVTPAERVAKAVKEFMSAVCNGPTDGPLDYMEAVQWLRAVLLKEQQPTRDEPYRSVEKYATPQQQPVTTKEPIPTTPIPSCYPA
eukprot:11757836-Ditylum_brightwellii.AAC.1